MAAASMVRSPEPPEGEFPTMTSLCSHASRVEADTHTALRRVNELGTALVGVDNLNPSIKEPSNPGAQGGDMVGVVSAHLEQITKYTESICATCDAIAGRQPPKP